jgi:hypothetical protein
MNGSARTSAQLRARASNNTSGVKGVNFEKGSNRWRAMIKIDGRKIALGSFGNIELATKARLNAEAKHGFSQGAKKNKS